MRSKPKIYKKKIFSEKLEKIKEEKKMEKLIQKIKSQNLNIEDLNSRKKFIGLTEKDSENLKELKPYIQNELPKALELFYAQIRRTPETIKFFKNEDHIKHAKSAQESHWNGILNGNLDENYAKRVEKIGLVHAHIGLEPRWYIGGYSILTEIITKHLMKELLKPEGFPKRSKMTIENAANCITSLNKVIMLEMDLTISVYFNEAENMKQKAANTAIAEQQKLVSESFGEVLKEISDGNLTKKLKKDVPDAYNGMKESINSTVQTLQETISNVKENVFSLEKTTQEINNISDTLNQKTEDQSTSVQRTAATVEEITATVSMTSQRVEEAHLFVKNCQKTTEGFKDIVHQTQKAMEEIQKSSAEIKNITNVISNIAAQTNILALNTGIEAARAGESGKGFQILAQEIRALSHQTTDSSKNVKGLIETSHQHVLSGVDLMEQTTLSLNSTIDDIQKIAEQLNAISGASKEEAAALQDINSAISLIDEGTRQNQILVEKSHIASEELKESTDHLHRLIDSFQTE